ncbi:hypothetical protein VNO77_05801 [Canavalia gladiata]|uniref:Uncharacterized protein n=1 Tax=Canavalia gladiata TaxID=3824 RepID=A0AAN9R913_CANGL
MYKVVRREKSESDEAGLTLYLFLSLSLLLSSVTRHFGKVGATHPHTKPHLCLLSLLLYITPSTKPLPNIHVYLHHHTLDPSFFHFSYTNPLLPFHPVLSC